MGSVGSSWGKEAIVKTAMNRGMIETTINLIMEQKKKKSDIPLFLSMLFFIRRYNLAETAEHADVRLFLRILVGFQLAGRLA